MKDFLDALVVRFEGLEDHLNALDAAIGDGDHGTTMLKGLRAAAASPDAPAKAFRKAAGGASGSLFGVLLAALDRVHQGAMDLPEALAEAAAKITQIGEAVAGDKTMLDALIPAAAEETPLGAAEAARNGAEATLMLAAKRGRARYVEGAGVGHVDAGATSVAEILEALVQVEAASA